MLELLAKIILEVDAIISLKTSLKTSLINYAKLHGKRKIAWPMHNKNLNVSSF